MFVTILSLSIHSYSQQISDQGYSGNKVGNSPSKRPESVRYILDGRDVIKKTIPPSNICFESGKVEIEIVVDKKGNVLEAKLGKGSTTNSSCLVDASKKAALNTKWNIDKKAFSKQAGKIIYYFIVD